jgi:hypothetical protein
MKHPLPSPTGRNAERLFSDAAWLAPRGPAYDSANGLQPEPSPAAKVAKILVDSLSQDELNELGHEVVKARDASLDPYATRAVPASEVKRERNSGGSAMDARRRARIAQDAKFASAMKGAFAPGATARSIERKHAFDRALGSTIEQRLGIKLPDVAPLERNPDALPHSLASDAKINASLEERFPQLKKIGFAY